MTKGGGRGFAIVSHDIFLKLEIEEIKEKEINIKE
jgi:hypothetical protein